MPRVSPGSRRGVRLGRLSWSILVVLGSGTPLASAQAPVADVVDRATAATVHVQVLFARTGRTGSSARAEDTVRVERPSSGVILSASGLVLTNAHLVAEIPEGERGEGAEFWLRVLLASGRSHDATVVARDERVDLALLQLQLGDGETLVGLPLAQPEDAVPGQRVVGLGFPEGEQPFAFAGALAFAAGPVRLREALLQPDEVLLSDARFHRVLDGGALLSSQGRVVGIHNASHIGLLPVGFEDEDPDDDGEPPRLDYAVIVSAHAVRTAFGPWLAAIERPRDPVEAAAPERAAAAIAVVAPGVVSVWTDAEHDSPLRSDPADPQGQRLPAGLGSGVIVDPAGLVLTAADLFDDSRSTARVRLATGEVFDGRLLQRSADTGAALVQLSLPEGRSVPVAAQADPDEALGGEVIAVVGRPHGSTLTLSVGVLSAPRGRFLQLASWVHAGHRGGAVVDVTGRLLGIAIGRPTTPGAPGESYLSFATSLASLREEFASAWRVHGAAGEVPVPRPASPEELLLRQNPARAIVEATHGSLVNVVVSKATAPSKSGGFSPFARPEQRFVPLGLGSGVLIDETGLAISNWHVVDAAMTRSGEQSEDYQVRVTLQDGAEYEARVLSTSRDDDLALLQLQLEAGETLKPVVLGDSDLLRIGETVVAIGNPHGLSNSVSAGIVSSREHAAMIKGRARMYPDMLITDAAINPGNSGGALLDGQGRLVGINSAGAVGWGLAIPVNKAREVFRGKLLSVDKLHSTYLGLTVVDDGGHVVVDGVDPDGPAAKARVEVGDNLLRMGGREVISAVEFAQLQLATAPNVPLALEFVREGTTRKVELVPLSYAAWRIRQQCGIEVVEVDPVREAALIHAAAVALYRAYTGNASAEPTRLMRGALRVAAVESRPGAGDLDVLPGDLLLGLTLRSDRLDIESDQLVRVESLQALRAALDPLATLDGTECDGWLLRDGEIVTTKIAVRRPRER